RSSRRSRNACVARRRLFRGQGLPVDGYHAMLERSSFLLSETPLARAKCMTRLIVTGLIAQHSALGGVDWDYLQFVRGLAALGFEVYYIEDSGEWPYNWNGGATGHAWVATDCSENVSQLARSFDAFGLNDRWAYRFPPTGKWFGLTDLKRNEVIKTADALLNVSGSLDKPELYRAIPKLIYIDTDPAFTQIALSTDEVLRHRIGVHDCHFSVGENINTWNSMDR